MSSAYSSVILNRRSAAKEVANNSGYRLRTPHYSWPGETPFRPWAVDNENFSALAPSLSEPVA